MFGARASRNDRGASPGERVSVGRVLSSPRDWIFREPRGKKIQVSETQSSRGAEKVGNWLLEFERLADRGPYSAPFIHHFPADSGNSNQRHLVIGVITHGNEFGTLPALLRLQRELLSSDPPRSFSVTLLLGNPEAARQGRRFVEEDFNRVMTFDRPADNLERRRADEVRPILDSADFFLDIHQTQTPTETAFWTMPWEGDLGLFARALGGARAGLTRARGGQFSQGKCCLDEYVRSRGKVGITVEVGERGEDEKQEELAYQVMRRALKVQEQLLCGSTLESLAVEMPQISWYATKDVVRAASSEHRLRPGIYNFAQVRSGELLSASDSPEIRASTDGRILFPKYPAPGDPPPAELFRLGVRIDDPQALYG